MDELQAGNETMAEKTSTTSDMQMILPLMAEIKEELKSSLMRVKEESEKLYIQKQRS